MSHLEFNDTYNRISVHSRTGAQLASFPANNNVDSRSRGIWPSGTFTYSHWSPHAGANANSSYGSNGNFVFNVSGRSGMGVHSGRASARGVDHHTMGCIRTNDAGTAFIRQLHEGGFDRLATHNA